MSDDIATTYYELGRHDERQRTMQLIGGVRMDMDVMPSDPTGKAFDKLVMNIVAQPLTDRRELQQDEKLNQAAEIADSIVRRYASDLAERGDEGRDILNYTDYIKGQKDGAMEVRVALSATPTKDSAAVSPETPTEDQISRSHPCVHSMMKSDCLGCAWSHAARLQKQLEKLEASTVLPIGERVEKAVREHVSHCYAVYKGVPPSVEDWVGGAVHYVMWGLERDIPLASSPDTEAQARKAAEEIVEYLMAPGWLIGDREIYARNFSDIIMRRLSPETTKGSGDSDSTSLQVRQ